jgi:hypothetical protein
MTSKQTGLCLLQACRPHYVSNTQTVKVWQPRRAARSKRPNTPSDGTKTNGAVTHPETEVPTNCNHLGDLNQLSIRITMGLKCRFVTAHGTKHPSKHPIWQPCNTISKKGMTATKKALGTAEEPHNIQLTTKCLLMIMPSHN